MDLFSYMLISLSIGCLITYLFFKIGNWIIMQRLIKYIVDNFDKAECVYRKTLLSREFDIQTLSMINKTAEVYQFVVPHETKDKHYYFWELDDSGVIKTENLDCFCNVDTLFDFRSSNLFSHLYYVSPPFWRMCLLLDNTKLTKRQKKRLEDLSDELFILTKMTN